MGYWVGSTWHPDDADPIAASMSRSGAQTVNDSTVTPIQLTTSDLSSGNLFKPTVDAATNYRITVQKAGYYRVTGQATCTTLAAAGTATVYVYKNGSSTLNASIAMGGAAGVYPLWVSKILLLASGDYLDLRAYQNSGNAQSFGLAQLDVHLLR